LNGLASAHSWAFDNNGNTLTKVTGSNTTSYAWDFENRLSSVTLPGSGGTVTFKYDPFGRRIYKSSSSATSVYAYDGDNLIEETNSSGGVVARYSQTQNIDEPLAMLRAGATSYFHADGLGSVTSLSNAAGSIANTYTYDSFGKLTASTGSLVNPFQYTARESDTETGLYYYRARYYDQSQGRLISEDPIRFVSGDANFYRYVRGSTPQFRDPWGLWGFGSDFNVGFYGGLGSGTGGSISAGTLFFRKESCPTGFKRGGTSTSGSGFAPGLPDQVAPFGNSRGNNPTYGFNIGIAGGFTFTNANSIQDLAGTFDNTSYAFGPATINVGRGDNGVITISVTGGVGFGLGISHFKTNTIVGPPPAGSDCGCQ
jgi:RHS repeat-associated protein